MIKLKKIKFIISTLLILGILSIAIWIAASFRLYQMFSKEELFATLYCEKPKDPAFDYIIFYKPQNQKEPTVYGLKGDQWRLEGVVIKWKAFVNLLGIHTWHKPIRLSGRFSSSSIRQGVISPSEYILNGGEDSFWRFIYRAKNFLPFIEATYGSGVFLPCRKDILYKIYITNSGYIVKTEKKNK